MILFQNSTPDFERSLAFYRNLNFQVEEHENFAWIYDSQVAWQLMKDRSRRHSIHFFEAERDEVLQTPGGVLVYFHRGKAPDLLERAENTPFSLLGNYAGISVEVLDLETEIAWWERFHFKITAGKAEQGWCAMMSDDFPFGISLMKIGVCPHQFLSPSFTYFNGKKNVEIIEKLRKSNVSFFEEITAFNEQGLADNVILASPCGLGFFIFSD